MGIKEKVSTTRDFLRPSEVKKWYKEAKERLSPEALAVSSAAYIPQWPLAAFQNYLQYKLYEAVPNSNFSHEVVASTISLGALFGALTSMSRDSDTLKKVGYSANPWSSMTYTGTENSKLSTAVGHLGSIGKLTLSNAYFHLGLLSGDMNAAIQAVEVSTIIASSHLIPMNGLIYHGLGEPLVKGVSFAKKNLINGLKEFHTNERGGVWRL